MNAPFLENKLRARIDATQKLLGIIETSSDYQQFLAAVDAARKQSSQLATQASSTDKMMSEWHAEQMSVYLAAGGMSLA